MSKPRTISDYPNRADDYESAAEKAHDQNTDSALDEGGDHEVTAEAIRDHVDSAANPHGTTADQVGAYTKGEADDLLDGKADQSALNATNHAIDNLDGRVDTAEDNIQGLESSKAPLSNAVMSGVLGFHDNARVKRMGNVSGSSLVFLIAARSDNGVDTVGTLIGHRAFNNQTGMLRIDFSAYSLYQQFATNQYSSITARLDAPDHGNINIEPISCTYDGTNYFAIHITAASGPTGPILPNSWYVSWVCREVSNEPTIVPYSSVSNVEPVNRGRTTYEQPVHVQGTVRADDFITTSRVESDRANALAALDNISEWKKADGSIDYKKHYAYTPRVVMDEKGKVIEEKPGLSMEKRVAMLEKMVAELSDQLQNGKTQRK